MKRFGRQLSIEVLDTSADALHEESFIANGDVFIKDNVAINSSGIAIRNNPKTFTLHYDELQLVISHGMSKILFHVYRVKAASSSSLAMYCVRQCMNVTSLISNFVACLRGK